MERDCKKLGSVMVQLALSSSPGVSFLHDTTLISQYFFVFLILGRGYGGYREKIGWIFGVLNYISVVLPNLITPIA